MNSLEKYFRDLELKKQAEEAGKKAANRIIEQVFGTSTIILKSCCIKTIKNNSDNSFMCSQCRTVIKVG